MDVSDDSRRNDGERHAANLPGHDSLCRIGWLRSDVAILGGGLADE